MEEAVSRIFKTQDCLSKLLNYVTDILQTEEAFTMVEEYTHIDTHTHYTLTLLLPVNSKVAIAEFESD